MIRVHRLAQPNGDLDAAYHSPALIFVHLLVDFLECSYGSWRRGQALDEEGAVRSLEDRALEVGGGP